MKQIEQITQGLWNLQDCSYRDFQAKLIPTLDKEKIGYVKFLVGK